MALPSILSSRRLREWLSPENEQRVDEIIHILPQPIRRRGGARVLAAG